MEAIRSAALGNMNAHSKAVKTKQFYNFVLVSGASGVGKSRLCYEACEALLNSTVSDRGMDERELVERERRERRGREGEEVK
jgi:hypothetical protein